MPIQIFNPEKSDFIEKDGGKIFFKYPPKETILDCFARVFGGEFDIQHLDITKLNTRQTIKIIEEIAYASIIGWENIQDQDNESVDFKLELIEYLDYNLKLEIFNKVLNFFVKSVGGEIITSPAEKKTSHHSKTTRKSSSKADKTLAMTP